MGLGLASSSRLNLRLRRVRPPNHQGAGWPGVCTSRERMRGLHRVTGWVPLGAVAWMADGGERQASPLQGRDKALVPIAITAAGHLDGLLEEPLVLGWKPIGWTYGRDRRWGAVTNEKGGAYQERSPLGVLH